MLAHYKALFVILNIFKNIKIIVFIFKLKKLTLNLGKYELLPIY